MTPKSTKVAQKVSDALYVGKVNSSELLSILLMLFKRANWLSQSAQRFGTDENSSYVDVSFNKEGTIELITSPLREDELKALSDRVRAVLIDDQKKAVGQALCFSKHVAVHGVYRYKDAFQVLPVPTEAVHAPVLVADHPFVLQFRYVRCPNREINSSRRLEQTAKFTRTLNVVCRPALVPRSPYVRFFWSAFVPGQSTPQWLQEGYGYQGFVPEIEVFSEVPELPSIKLYPKEVYYGDKFMTDEMALPDLIDEYLDRVFVLNADDSRKFAIASTWFSQVPALWSESSSSAFVAVVSAVEALLDKRSDICGECGQPKYGITKKFKKFLEDHVPNVKTRFPEELNQIYKVRSDLAHGAKLLLADLEPWNFLGEWRRQQEDAVQRNTHEIVATALRNWILKH